MTKKSRRDFLEDAVKLGVVSTGAAILPATLDDILDVNNVEAQPAAATSTTERLAYTIHLRNFDTRSPLGIRNDQNAGVANFTITHTPTTYRIRATAQINIHDRVFQIRNVHAWVRLGCVIRGAFSHEDGLPQFQPQYYWLRYREGEGEPVTRESTTKEFFSDIHFYFDQHQARSHGFHEIGDQGRVGYGAPSPNRLISSIAPSTRDIVSAMMKRRFQPAQDGQINTIIEGQPESIWLLHEGTGQFRPTGGRTYPTNKFRLHFRSGILPEANQHYDLMIQIHQGGDRTPVTARHVRSDGSEIRFVLRNYAAKLTGTSLYPAP